MKIIERICKHARIMCCIMVIYFSIPMLSEVINTPEEVRLQILLIIFDYTSVLMVLNDIKSLKEMDR